MNKHNPPDGSPNGCLPAARINNALSRCVRQLGRLSIPARVALGIVAAAATAIGCGWFGSSESVRFTYRLGVDGERRYAHLPPLSSRPKASARLGEAEADEEESYAAMQRREEDLNTLWAKATGHGASRGELARSDLESVRQELRAFLQETELEQPDYWLQKSLTIQEKRNTAHDLLDALAALDHASPVEHVWAYLAARYAYDQWLASFVQPPEQWSGSRPGPEEEARLRAEYEADREAKVAALPRALDAVPRDHNLDDNVAYLRAAMLYREAKFAEAAGSFKALAAAYPRSEKREAALLMIALSGLKVSKSYSSDDATALSSDPCRDCRDEAWKAARAAFVRLLREYPRGRYAADARGWLGYLSLRVGETSAGLAEYYRLLSDEANGRGRAEALNSLAMARAHADEAAMSQLEVDLSDEPTVALTYAYHNLYNYAVDLNAYDYEFDGDESDKSDSETEQDDEEAEQRLERKKEDAVRTAQGREFQRIAGFATRMLRRYPRAATTSADFQVRVAAANLELGENHAAHEFARRALVQGGSGGERRDDALWIKGVAEYRLREYDAARRTLKNLVEGNSQGRLTKGARILLALVAEDAGDLDGALEQYLLLDYKEDAAYFIDVLMSPEQLAAFIASHPQAAPLNELNYALGVRYLRAGRYAEARAAYAHIRTSRADADSWSYDYDSECNKDGSPDPNAARCESPKLAGYDPKGGVPSLWVLRDLKTAETLEWFERSVEAAQGDEAQAEALYQMASYIYESDLLFYNPAAWSGSRHYYLSDLANLQNYRAPNEAQALWDYAQSHDTAARALALYLEVVRRFPGTRAAQDALYTAAVCHERLAGYNGYWRTAYANGLHAGARLVTYRDVRAAYPAYKFPRGTFGWQPSTRTVNGGPGWDAPPRPRPRPTRLARIKLILAAWQPSFVESWNGWTTWLRHWLTVASFFAAALIAGRVAARTRRQLRLQLARHRQQQQRPPELTESAPSPPALAPWLTTEGATRGWLEGMSRQLKPRAAVLYNRLRLCLEPLLHDAPGRAALASSALAHTILIVILFELLRVI